MSALQPPRCTLTDQAHWDGVHLAEDQAFTGSRPGSGRPDASLGAWTRLKARVKARLGPGVIEAMRAYDEHLLWNVILPPYLDGRSGRTAVEIGSAPGDFLARLHARFGIVPYGIEYSPPGAELNRRVFAAHGLDPANVIEADFFSPELHAQYREWFDVVVSRGFIEHFRDVRPVVGRHLDLLKPGGLLVVSIPNMRGLNLALSWMFHRRVVAMHNLQIMVRRRFADLFPAGQVERLFCDYYGTFSFYLFNTRPGSPMRLPLAACMKAQPALNAAFRRLFRDRGAESRWFSPNLLFVGIKR